MRQRLQRWSVGRHAVRLVRAVHRPAVLSALATALALGGCASLSGVIARSSTTLAFENQASCAVRVMVCIDAPQGVRSDGDTIPSNGARLVRPGESIASDLADVPGWSGRDTIVHLRVDPVRPTWQTAEEPDWLELLSGPPLTVVVRGEPGKLVFEAVNGQIALVPEQEIRARRFRGRTAGVSATDD